MQTSLSDASQVDAEAASELIHASFTAVAAVDWEVSARTKFLQESAPQAIAAAIASAAVALVASTAGRTVGFLLMPSPRLLALLFVHPEALRTGIGSCLWERARSAIEVAHPEVQTVELNATPNSVPFYCTLGFVPISKEFAHHGCRATRMACWLPARSRNCSVGNAP